MIASPNLGADRFFERDGRADLPLEFVGGAFADEQVVAALHVLGDGLGDDLATGAGGFPDHDAVHGEDSSLGTSSAEVDDQRAAGVTHGNARADRGGERVGDQVCRATGSSLFSGVADGALLNVGHPDRRGDHHLRADEVEAARDLRHVVTQERLDDEVVIDDAFTHRVGDGDALGGTSEQVGSVGAGGDDGTFALREGDN